MIIEKMESIIVIKYERKKTKEFLKWLSEYAKKYNITLTINIKKRFLFGNNITIKSLGIEGDVEKFEESIKNKLLYE